MTKSNRSKLVKAHQPCLNPQCGSSDALSIYDDGHSFCFSCGSLFPANRDASDKKEIPTTRETQSASNAYASSDETGWTYEFLPWRGITSETMRAFNVRTKIDSTGKPRFLGFPYSDDAFIIRSLDEKKFFTKGNIKGATLFGKDKFSPGSSKSCTITEGALDALSVYQMLGSRFPVFSVRSATSAKGDCAAEQEYLNSFERIYLCFDNDDSGQTAAKAVAELFDFNKVYRVALNRKDPNEYLQAKEEKAFVNSWHAAKKYVPEGIISTFQEFDEAIEQQHTDAIGGYPWPTIENMTLGIRPKELVLVKAFTGVGKTEFISSVEYHNLTNFNEPLGVIHIEEPKDRILKRIAGYELNIPVHLKSALVSNDEVKEAYRKAIKTEDRLHIYSHFGSSDPSVIIDIIRFMVSVLGCRIVFLDHISMVVSGTELVDERKTLDILSTRLATLVNELSFAIVVISHVNDEGKSRGSRNIEQVANTIITLNRDINSSDVTKRNTTAVSLEKNRFGSLTGPACSLIFNPSTWKLTEVTPLETKIPTELIDGNI